MKKQDERIRGLVDTSVYADCVQLQNGDYITVQFGENTGCCKQTNLKPWSDEHYKELIRLLKNVYPSKKIVQIKGTYNSESSKRTDINLHMTTSCDRVEDLLKHTWLHIDGKYGVIYFQKILQGNSSDALLGEAPIRIRRELTPALVLNKIVGWDKLTKIKGGKINDALEFLNYSINENQEIVIDEDYKNNILNSKKIYYYEKQTVKGKDLTVHIMAEDGLKYVALKDAPAYAMAGGNEQIYETYIGLLQRKLSDKIHTKERFRKLLQKMDRDGYDKKKCILIDGDYHILDGQHRAAWIASRKGLDSEINALKIYCLADDEFDWFPFERIPKGSNIIIYGAGAIGLSYVKQITYTGYCNIISLIDRNPKLWNAEENRNIIPCISSEDITRISKPFQYVVIASRHMKHIAEMAQFLISKGIDKDYIIAPYGFQ